MLSRRGFIGRAIAGLAAITGLAKIIPKVHIGSIYNYDGQIISNFVWTPINDASVRPEHADIGWPGLNTLVHRNCRCVLTPLPIIPPESWSTNPVIHEDTWRSNELA